MSGEAIRDKVQALVDTLRLVTDHEGAVYALHPRDCRGGAGEFVEVVPLRSRLGRLLLVELYMAEHGSVPSSQGLAEGLLALESKARGAVQDVGLRTMLHGGGIALDLTDDTWTRVIVDRDNWQSVHDGPLFRRGQGALPQHRPLPGGDLRALRPFVNVATDDDFLLLLAWLCFALRPGGPYPILALQGEQGSSKSTVAKILVELIDPNLAPLAPAPKDSQHLMVIAKNRHVLAFDNLSRIDSDLKDNLCRLATGSGHFARRLFTDGDAVCWHACRPIILNGIDNLLVADDLTDRAIVLTLPPIPEAARRAESDFWRDFKSQRGLLLGALLDAVSSALRSAEGVKLVGGPRMADFARWGGAVAPCFGATADDFLRAYKGNRDGAVESGLEGSPLARVLRAFLEVENSYHGTFGKLLTALDATTDNQMRMAPNWPRSARGLQNAIRRLAPALRTVGVLVQESGRSKAGSGISLAWKGSSDAGDAGDGGSNDNLLTLPLRSDRGEPSLPSLSPDTVTQSSRRPMVGGMPR